MVALSNLEFATVAAAAVVVGAVCVGISIRIAVVSAVSGFITDIN